MKNHIMLDLETLSTEPNAAIISIGAVMFTKDGVSDYRFYQTIDIESNGFCGRHMSYSTVSWWMKQDLGARKEFQKPAEKLPIVLSNFRDWFTVYDIDGVWGNGSDFDNLILTSAFASVPSLTIPWKYYQNRCYRTLKNLVNIPLERSGTHHNALDDAVTQAEHAVKIMKHLNIGE